MSDTGISAPDYRMLFGEEAIEPGDAVVHFEHGLARYEGESPCDLGDEKQILTTFVYRNGGKLMVPAEQGVDYWAFGAPATEVDLDRLRTQDWVRRRDEMIAELRQSADHLLAEDEARRAHTATKMTPDETRFDSFTAAFGHPETADQTRAIAAVRKDLALDVPMNRLLVGDVGFGKTEVALRAAAIAALSGHQVVLAAPTTILARQHYDTLCARFAGVDIEVAEVSRLMTTPGRDDTFRAIADGTAKVIVGTQALLGSDLVFSDLALVIIDEEQKFGREQKQALRNLAPGIHILSMTATPIPRSLAAAEVGLTDVSVLATAPADRKPIETRNLDLDPGHLFDAIETEVARGGQCYVVCPRVTGVEELDALLRSEERDFSFGVAHGQMDDTEMESETLRFMQGEIDVLLSTSIIESGLDNGRANTMVVWNAERFGLSQLHQLRGRVGRSKIPAQMLLLSAIDPEVDTDAAARLKGFAEMSEIGSGFRIARRDREIRGFGTLDGDEQSGQLSRLGIGLYRHVLRQHLGDRIGED